MKKLRGLLLMVCFVTACGQAGKNGSLQPTRPLDPVADKPVELKVVAAQCFDTYGVFVTCKNVIQDVTVCGIKFRVGAVEAWVYHPDDGFWYGTPNGEYETADGCKYAIDNYSSFE